MEPIETYNTSIGPMLVTIAVYLTDGDSNLIWSATPIHGANRRNTTLQVVEPITRVVMVIPLERSDHYRSYFAGDDYGSARAPVYPSVAQYADTLALKFWPEERLKLEEGKNRDLQARLEDIRGTVLHILALRADGQVIMDTALDEWLALMRPHLVIHDDEIGEYPLP
jgi:hypothetical protein